MFQKILDMVSANGYIKQVCKENVKYLKFGPVGLLLQNNLKTQWCNNIIINKDITVFPSKGDVHDTFEYSKKMCMDKLPFGIAETIKPVLDDDKIKILTEINKDKNLIVFGDFFEKQDQLTLQSSIFVQSETATQFFHQWLKQRRMWWRKFSAAPGRYSLKDIKIKSPNKQSVDIQAEYPWGFQLLETIELSNKSERFPSKMLQFKEGKKNLQASIVISKVNVPSMFLNAICDAYDEPPFRNDRRQLLRLHRKLVPYRISFAISGSSAAKVTELNDLALYLAKQLRVTHVSTLFLPSSTKFSLEAQFKQYDQLGVPYTIVLNDRTLVDGIFQLRSRDTTLKEQVHVTNLVSYVEQLFKND